MTRLSMVVACLSLVAIVLSLVRRRRIAEQHALRWLLGITAFGIVVAVPIILESMATFFDVKDPTNVIFAAGFYILAVLALRQQVEISKLQDEHRILVREFAVESSMAQPASPSAD
ncbi:MAG: DUF2304 domain-containing protein [Acidimicrobiia bacterium]|nr:DUF2304 domain-containing protein [Acidimicrobiia bacterium]NNF65468.1 DUF2304 domain-containing protein [Acidimicrobiia bacterium]